MPSQLACSKAAWMPPVTESILAAGSELPGGRALLLWATDQPGVVEVPALPATHGRAGVPAEPHAPATVPVLPLTGDLRPGPCAILEQDLGLSVLGDGGAGHGVGRHRPLQRRLSGRVRGDHLARMRLVP